MIGSIMVINTSKFQRGWTKPLVLFLLLVVVVGGYIGYEYGVRYYKAHKADQAIKEIASATYSRRSEQHRWFEIEASIRNDLQKRILDILEIPREDLSILVRKREKGIHINVEWSMVVSFVLFDVTDRLEFKKEYWAETK